MKVYLSNYRDHWLSSFAIMKKVLFWKTEDDIYEMTPPKWLQNICENLKKFLDIIHPRISCVKIDGYDVWNFPETLGLIVLPMLIEMKKQKHGSPFVSDLLVPDHLKSMNSPRVQDEWDVDDNYHKRFEWALDEMIFAFGQLNIDWKEQYRTGDADLVFEGNEVKRGPNHTMETDYDGMSKHQNRMQRGFRLFGELYQGLWT